MKRLRFGLYGETDAFRSPGSWPRHVRRAGRRMGCRGFLLGRERVWPEDSGFPAGAAWFGGPCRPLWVSGTGRPVRIQVSLSSGMDSVGLCWFEALNMRPLLCSGPERLKWRGNILGKQNILSNLIIQKLSVDSISARMTAFLNY